MEKWQREGHDSFGAWRRADQKRRDDEKKAARADAAAAAAAAPLLPPPPQPVVIAMPIPEGVRDVRVKDVRGCPGPTCSLSGVTGCSLYGTKHVHCKRVRVATVPIASVVRLLPIPVTPTTVTETDGMAGSPPRQKLGTLYERVDVTPGGSRVHTLERTTPRGSRLTTTYTSPAAAPNASREYRHTASGQLNLSDASRAAKARGKRKAGIPPAPHAQRQRRSLSPLPSDADSEPEFEAACESVCNCASGVGPDSRFTCAACRKRRIQAAEAQNAECKCGTGECVRCKCRLAAAAANSTESGFAASVVFSGFSSKVKRNLLNKWRSDMWGE